jgi:hypothetical protein
MVLDAGDVLHTWRGQATTDDDEEISSDIIKGRSLATKLRFIRLDVSLSYPALLLLAKHTITLTADELQTLEVLVTMFAQDLRDEEADGFYAEPPNRARVWQRNGQAARATRPCALWSQPHPDEGGSRLVALAV